MTKHKILLGYSLIELLISMSLGIVVMTQVFNLSTAKIAAQQKHIADTRLQQELRAMTALLENDLQRAGYWNATSHFANSPHNFFYIQQDCVIFSYDQNQDGSLAQQSNEKIAYRFNADKLQTRKDANNCNDGRWESINDPEVVKLESFTIEIDYAHSRCRNLSSSNTSSCNPQDCSYQPYKSGDLIQYQYALELHIGARHLADDLKRTHQSTVFLNNPIIKTASDNGPATADSHCV